MTSTLRKKIISTNITFWLTAVVVSCLLVFIPEDGRAVNLIPVAVAVCGWVSMLSMNSILPRGDSTDKESTVPGAKE